MLRYYITDRHGTSDLLGCISRAVADGVDYIQIREKDLDTRRLVALARAGVAIAANTSSRILVNSRVDVAMAAGADGVHLPADAVSATEWRRVVPRGFVIGASCHTLEEIRDAAAVDLLVFGPVFATAGKGPAVGLAALEHAARVSRVPLLALGGVNEVNAQSCVAAGAAGIAAIRMFQSTESR